ncbi:hypothetical protein M378DRAFT_182993 [Amanita muscaria Koide BX008]|uniref:RRM domain-containing protein n=1 Tax=Amanita muscaria (strain Koide BX008) TaxID=946122 RepID=A0A0C2XB22_AMAMK|nr:hypothetical protein M378DRAFT_182993 [Amanita muscaria Koide BX008]
MNRHHPYGGGFEGPGPRRGGFSGPGPDRSNRYQDRGSGHIRGRGFGRGRGNYPSYDGNMSHHATYDQGVSQNNIGAYNEYDSQAATQEPYYGHNYGAATAAQFTQGLSNGYNQGYGKFEDGPGSTYEDDTELSRGQRRPFRKEKEVKVPDSVIEERIQRERPCRTLFIRNIKYETNSEDVRRMFEEHGDIKTFFDLIATRGMVFVTYYDLRAAERARERLQGSEISGRPIDVHYSLPRDDHGKGGDREKNQQFQGTVQVTLRNSSSGQPIDDNEVRRKFQQFGDVKSVSPVGDRIDSRYVEFYDTRACDEAFDRLRHQGLQDGVMDIVFAWEVTDGAVEATWEESPRGGGGFRGGGRGRGRMRGRGRGHEDDHDRRGDHGRHDKDGRGRGGRSDDFFNRPKGSGSYDERFESGRGSFTGTPANGYETGGNVSGYSSVPQPATDSNPSDDRLEQARKVQQLLAALKQPQVGPPVAPAPLPPSTSSQSMPPIPPIPMSAGAYYPPPGTSPLHNPPFPPHNPYGVMPPLPPGPQSNQAPPHLSPNILALLQSAQRQTPPTPQYGVPPPMMNSPPPSQPGSNANPQYQQLMSYLVSASATKCRP